MQLHSFSIDIVNLILSFTSIIGRYTIALKSRSFPLVVSLQSLGTHARTHRQSSWDSQRSLTHDIRRQSWIAPHHKRGAYASFEKLTLPFAFHMLMEVEGTRRTVVLRIAETDGVVAAGQGKRVPVATSALFAVTKCSSVGIVSVSLCSLQTV